MATTRKPWNRSELLILLNLYEKIPFGKFDQSDPLLVGYRFAYGAHIR